MSKLRSPFSEAVTKGPFAIIYWGVMVVGIIAVVEAVFGSLEQRIITGILVFAALGIVIAARFVVAARIRRQREQKGTKK